MNVELAPAFRLSNIGPVRCLIVGAGNAVLFDEGFEKDGSVPIPSMPVRGNPLCCHREDAGGEVRISCKDKEPGIVHHEVEVLLPGLGVPPDESIPGGTHPCGGREAQKGDNLVYLDGTTVRGSNSTKVMGVWLRAFRCLWLRWRYLATSLTE